VTEYRFMKANQGWYTVRKMAGVFGVSSNAYYRWAKHGVSGRRKDADAELVRLIREIMIQHHFRYGSPRVREVLHRDYGRRVSRKKVACLTGRLWAGRCAPTWRRSIRRYLRWKWRLPTGRLRRACCSIRTGESSIVRNLFGTGLRNFALQSVRV
jgi:hypothetical protein